MLVTDKPLPSNPTPLASVSQTRNIITVFRTKRFDIGLILILVIFSFSIRFAFKDWALPFVLFDDEPLDIEYSWYFLNGNWLWHGKGFFDYPYLGLYLFSIFHRLHWIITQPDNPTFYTQVLSLIQDSRIVSAISGAGGCAVLFLIGKYCYGRGVGFVAGLFFAVAGIPVYYGALAKPDVMAATFALVALLYSLKLIDASNSSYYKLAGLWLGLALSTKFNVVASGVVFIICHFTGRYRENKRVDFINEWVRFKSITFYKKFWQASGIAAAAFFLGTPLYLIDPLLLVNGVIDRFVAGSHLKSFQAFMTPLQSPLDPLKIELNGILSNLFQISNPAITDFFSLKIENLFIFVCLLALGGALLRGSRYDRVLAVLVILYFGPLFQYLRVPMWHYLLPAVPALLLLTANMLFTLGKLWQSCLSKLLGNRPALYKYTPLAGFLVSLIMVAAFTGRMLSGSLDWENTIGAEAWQKQLDWLTLVLPVGSKVAYERANPELPKQLYSTDYVYYFNKHPYNWYIENNFNYILISPANVERSRSGFINEYPYQNYVDLQQKAKLIKQMPGSWLQGDLEVWQLPTYPAEPQIVPEDIFHTLQPGKVRPQGFLSPDFSNSTDFLKDWYPTNKNAISQGKFILRMNTGAQIGQLIPKTAFSPKPILQLTYQYEAKSPPLQIVLKAYVSSGEFLGERRMEIPAASISEWNVIQFNLKQEIEKSGAEWKWVGFLEVEFDLPAGKLEAGSSVLETGVLLKEVILQDDR